MFRSRSTTAVTTVLNAQIATRIGNPTGPAAREEQPTHPGAGERCGADAVHQFGVVAPCERADTQPQVRHREPAPADQLRREVRLDDQLALGAHGG